MSSTQNLIGAFLGTFVQFKISSEHLLGHSINSESQRRISWHICWFAAKKRPPTSVLPGEFSINHQVKHLLVVHVWLKTFLVSLSWWSWWICSSDQFFTNFTNFSPTLHQLFTKFTNFSQNSPTFHQLFITVWLQEFYNSPGHCEVSASLGCLVESFSSRYIQMCFSHWLSRGFVHNMYPSVCGIPWWWDDHTDHTPDRNPIQLDQPELAKPSVAHFVGQNGSLPPERIQRMEINRQPQHFATFCNAWCLVWVFEGPRHVWQSGSRAFHRDICLCPCPFSPSWFASFGETWQNFHPQLPESEGCHEFLAPPWGMSVSGYEPFS